MSEHVELPEDQIFNHIIVVGSGVTAEAIQTDGPYGVDKWGRVVQRLTVPSLTSVGQCRRVADLVLDHSMPPSHGDFDCALEDEIRQLVA